MNKAIDKNTTFYRALRSVYCVAGDTQKRIIGYVRENPSCTIDDVSAMVGIDAPNTGRVLREMCEVGILTRTKKEGTRHYKVFTYEVNVERLNECLFAAQVLAERF